MARKLRFGTFLDVSLFGPFGSNGMTKCSTKLNDTSQRLNIEFGTNSLCMLKRRGTGWWNKFRLVDSRRRCCSKASTNLGKLGVSFVKSITCILSGIGKGNAVSWVGVPLGPLVWWFGGCPWPVRWGGDLGLVGMVGCPWWVLVWIFLRGGVFASKGPRLLSMRARLFSWFYSFWRWPDWPSVSKNNNNNNM